MKQSLLQANLSPNLTICSCMTADQKLTITLTRDEKVDTKNGGLSLLRKQQFSLSLQEIEVLKKYLTLLEFFQLYHVYTNDAIQKTQPLPSYHSATN